MLCDAVNLLILFGQARVSQEPSVGEVTAAELETYKAEMADMRRVIEEQNRTIQGLMKTAEITANGNGSLPRQHARTESDEDGFELGGPPEASSRPLWSAHTQGS